MTKFHQVCIAMFCIFISTMFGFLASPPNAYTQDLAQAPVGGAALGDQVWVDINQDGVQDTNEPGVDDVAVNLNDCSGQAIDSAITADGGRYRFTGLQPGCYQIEFVAPAGYSFDPQEPNSAVVPQAPGDFALYLPIVQGGNRVANDITNVVEINLGAGETDTSVDMNVYAATFRGTIGDFVWNDLNGNGIQNVGEPGIDGVRVKLCDCNHNLLAETVTANGGQYRFVGLDPACYLLLFDKPAGFDFTLKNQGNDDTVDSDINPFNGETDPINLGTDVTDLTIDSGLRPSGGTASLGDFVWNDGNRNGIQDAGEPGINGVTVNLRRCNGALMATTTTAGGGLYRFNNLAPDCYYVQVIVPAGSSISPADQGPDDAKDSDIDAAGESPVVNLAANQTNLTIDAGLFTTGTATPTATPPAVLGAIGNRVFRDDNGNGIHDGTEPGVAGVTVRLKNCTGTVLATRTTSANGFYNFTGRAAGCYIVEFVLPAGFAFSPQDRGTDDNFDSDPNPTNGMTAQFNLAAGQTNNSIDAGLIVPTTPTATPTATTAPVLGAIGNLVFRDTNGNGIQDTGEPGIAGVTVRLKDCNNNVLGTRTTSTNGFYNFTSRPAGCYVVEFVLPAGFTFSPPDQGTDDNRDSDPNPANGMTGQINLAAGQTNNSIDGGMIPVGVPTATPTLTPTPTHTPTQTPTATPTTPVLPAALGNLVFRDNNANGIQDTGEPGISGVTVRLKNCSNTVLATRTTSTNGFYNFTNLTPGCYVVEFVLPTGLTFSPQDQGADDARDSDASPSNGMSGQVNLVTGETNNTIDAGMIAPAAALGDLVFRDDNSNGIQDAGEPGVDGVTVMLLDCNNNQLASTTTAGGGRYQFANLNAGCYVVMFNAPAGFVISPPDQGADDARDSDPNPGDGKTGQINLTAGQNNQTIDAGLIPRNAALGDLVFDDTNGNGIQDAGEPGVNGVTVMLLDCNSNQLATTTTANGGRYQFANLAAGCYIVMFNTPNGFQFSPQDQGGDDARDSDANPATGKTGPINLAVGQNNTTVDAGIRRKICLVIIDEEGIDNDMLTIIQAANSHGRTAENLVNDDRPTLFGNPWLRWNEDFPGDIVKLPTGQVDDEGWFALPPPPTIRYADARSTPLTYDQWIAAFVDGTLPQDQLDKVRDVMPLRSQDLISLVGRTCVAIVYDSDISMNYLPINANMQGARYGKFAFTVLAYEVPGSLPESGSSSSLVDLWVRVEPPMIPTETFQVPIRDHEPDSIQTTQATYSGGTLIVWGTSQFPGAVMTVSVDGADAGADRNVPPSVQEGRMVFRNGRFEYTQNITTNLDGRRLVISTNEGGSYNVIVQ